MNNLVDIDVPNLPSIKCEEVGCESEVFEQVFVIKKLSALVAKDGREQIIPMMTFRCVKCGRILEYDG